jgi:hypothetical protein
MGHAFGSRRILRIVALFAVAAMAGCMGASMEQTPLPAAEPQTSSQTYGTHASPSDDAPNAAPSDDDAPLSHVEQPSAAPTQTAAAKSSTARSVCRQPAPGRRACDAIVQGAVSVPAPGNCNRRIPYCASDIAAAYGVSTASRYGKNGVVAVVTAHGYPDAAADLRVYRGAMGLAGCAIASGCLRVVNQSGRANPLPSVDSDDDWRAEQALDLDVISAVCPSCKIVLVEANSSKSTDLAAAANAAVALGADAIANPYGGKEDAASDAAYRHPGRAIVASAGNAAVAQAPCAYAGVVCVAGTSLRASDSPRGWSERAWPAGSHRCSALVPKPAWQHVTGCKTRSAVDVAAIADPVTGVATYSSTSGGWVQMGGTSVGTAIVAALFALGPGSARANAPRWIWQHGTTGGYHHLGAKGGYDGATGWGSPNGTGGF